jgi:hypothetical protein
MQSKTQVDAYLSQLGRRNTEKSKFGEVFTPISVIDTMLASLPSTVWKNPDLVWCDPACGVGNFPLKIIFGGDGYIGLMDGLATIIPNRTKRLQHILESMLVCNDINASSIHTLLQTFRDMDIYPDTGLSLSHITVRDFLETDAEPAYDIIVGNPPYNAGGTKRTGEKRMHVRFTAHSLSCLRPGGYLLFVCPPNYREAGSTMNMLFRSREMSGGFRSIRIYGPNETHKLFKVQTRVDSFLWQDGYKGLTHIVDERNQVFRGNIDLHHHVPNFGFSIFEKLRTAAPLKLNAYRNTEATTITCEKSGLVADGKHKMLHLIVEDGMKVIRRNRPHTLQHVPKIILNGLGIPYVYYDREGKYGVTQTPVIIDNPSDELYAFMTSPLFYCMLWGLRITGNNNLPYMLEDIPADFGKHISFTADELAFIHSFRVPAFANKEIYGSCDSAGAKHKTRRRPRRKSILSTK